MGVHVARYEQGGKIRWAAVRGGALCPIKGDYASVGEFLANGRDGATKALVDTAPAYTVPVDSVSILNPITAPCNIVCQGLNYGTHREEAGASAEKAPFNLLFMKAASSLSGPFDDIVRPRGIRLLDYELELGLVIGSPITKRTHVTDENLADYVAGIVITNDVSARDVQIQQNQWFKGKSFRTFCPTGPYLYLLDAEDISRLHDIDVRLEVNGEMRQKANTNQLLYRPAETLTELSGLMDLNPGDLIQTGTPGGVAISVPSARSQRIARILMDERKTFRVFMKRQLKNPNYLKDGDVLTLTMRSRDGKIDLGTMRTRVVPEQ